MSFLWEFSVRGKTPGALLQGDISVWFLRACATRRRNNGQLLDGGDQVSATSSRDVERIEFCPLTNTISRHLLHLLQPLSHFFYCSSSPGNTFSPSPFTSAPGTFAILFYTFPSHHSSAASTPRPCVVPASEDVKVTGWQNIYRMIKPLQEKHT